MCQTPLTSPSGDIFACRRCNECISTRRFDWVSRAVAEMNTSPYTLVLALTYANDTEARRDAAKFFRYSDIQKFLKRLRTAIFYLYGERDSIRYLVVGEQGDRNGRVHWHIVLYSKFDLTTLGTISAFGRTITDRKNIVTTWGQKALRRHWSLWPDGFVSFQEADEGTMHYVLTYALKDQFTAVNSKGTGREAKVETFAVGLFRMSKSPPIGLPYINDLLNRLSEKGQVLPKVKLTVPSLRGYWWPRGSIRKHLLTGLRYINDQQRAAIGRNAPQWASLLHNCREAQKDMEILIGKEEPETFEDFARELSARSAFREAEKLRSKTRRKCGSTAPCTECLLIANGSDAGLDPEIEGFKDAFGNYSFRFKVDDPIGERLRQAQADGAYRGVHINCYQKESEHVKDAFPFSTKTNSQH